MPRNLHVFFVYMFLTSQGTFLSEKENILASENTVLSMCPGVKCKAHLITCHRGHKEAAEALLYSFLTSALDGVTD
jgi:hypothetical protein